MKRTFDALLHAFATHDERLDTYRADVAGLVDRLSPARPDNIALHERLLVDS